MRTLFVLAALLFPAVSLAQGLVPGGAAISNRGSEVRISRDDCRRLTQHQPAPDVAYQPGVDSRGRAVAPADLGGTPSFRMPDEISIAIGFDLQKRFGLPGASRNLYTGEGSVGLVVVDQQGRATFNGQPLSPLEQDEITIACQRSTR